MSVCSQPGCRASQCGAGIKAGTKLDFTMYYATGAAWLESALLQLKIQRGRGRHQHRPDPAQLQRRAGRGEGEGCPAAGCPWELANWGEGWSYVPDYLPTGDELFQTDSFANLGKYSNTTNDQYIKATLHSSDMSVMYKWEDYLTKQLPVTLQPDAPAALVESVDKLHIGVQSPTLAINPEQWYYLR